MTKSEFFEDLKKQGYRWYDDKHFPFLELKAYCRMFHKEVYDEFCKEYQKVFKPKQ